MFPSCTAPGVFNLFKFSFVPLFFCSVSYLYAVAATSDTMSTHRAESPFMHMKLCVGIITYMYVGRKIELNSNLKSKFCVTRYSSYCSGNSHKDVFTFKFDAAFVLLLLFNIYGPIPPSSTLMSL